MRTRTQQGVAAAAAGALLITAGCTDGGSWSDGAGPDPTLTMSAVSAITDGEVIRLSWAPVAEADRYRFSDGAHTTDVPATICGEQCSLAIADAPPGAQVAVSVVRADGAFSAPATTPVTAPGAPGGTVTGDEPAVLLVYEGDAYDAAARPRVEVIPVDSAEAAEQLIDDAYRSASGVLSASLNLPAGQLAGPAPRLVSQPAAGPPAEATWQVEAMRFDLRPGDPPGAGIVVATIEGGGVDAEHPSLRGVVADGHHVDAPAGEASGITGPTVHATGVASLIAGQPAGEVPGVAPGAQIYPVDIGDRRESDLIDGIIAAVDAGADIVNVSMALECRSLLGFTRCPDGIRAATDYAESKGVVVVAGAGNNGGGDQCGGEANADQWPAVLDTVISVGAYEPAGVVWPCTPYRPDIDVLAPGVRLLLAEPGGEYAIGSGTSFAAPLVSGLIAVLLAERPQLTPAEIRQLLPQWLRPNGELDVAAALISLGVVERIDTFANGDDSVVGIYPYEVGLGFAPEHPVHSTLWSLWDHERMLIGVPRRELAGQGPFDFPFWRTPAREDNLWDEGEQARLGYGVIEGVIFVHADGSATASGHWATERIVSSTHSGPWGTTGMVRGHKALCSPRLTHTRPVMKALRWDLPVTVEVTVLDEGLGADPPQFDLTFALGEGASATTPGTLPEPTVVQDTMERCAGQYAAYLAEEKLKKWELPYGEFMSLMDDYFAAVEHVNLLLVQDSPLTMAEPMVYGSYSETHAVQDPRVFITQTTVTLGGQRLPEAP